MDDLLASQVQTAFTTREPGLPGTGRVSTPDQARRVAEEFEAVFLAQLMEQMMGESTQSEMFGGGPGESAFRGMLNEEYAKVMARAGGIGLADDLAREMLRLQEAGAQR
ncbi:MAG: rod-binding protein [Caulobacterales bacterium]|uniref:rod-binding protein n=1 Tax=Glycocaulis sp. TaxID=1969725 RepID=UPI003FA13297